MNAEKIKTLTKLKIGTEELRKYPFNLIIDAALKGHHCLILVHLDKEDEDEIRKRGFSLHYLDYLNEWQLSW